jgi:hypothetical protein
MVLIENERKTGVFGRLNIFSEMRYPDTRACSRLDPLYNRNVTMATIMKIITSHFAISIVKPAIPFMPMMKKTRASIRNTTAR